jgi:hypothetical protein
VWNTRPFYPKLQADPDNQRPDKQSSTVHVIFIKFVYLFTYLALWRLKSIYIINNDSVPTPHRTQCLPLSHGATALSGPRPPHDRGFTITLRDTTHSRTPLAECSARRRDLYLATHNTHNIQTPMPMGRIRIRNPSKGEEADPRLRRRGQWDRPIQGCW